MDSTIKIEIGGIHKLHISTRLWLLDNALIEVERAVSESPSASPLISYRDPIPQSIKGEVVTTVAEARRAVAAIAGALELPPREESVTRALLGNLHVRVVGVAELHPRSLRSGGDVPPSLAEYIEPKADDLETLLRRLIALLEQQLQSERRPRDAQPDLKVVEMKLRRATGYFEETRLECERMADEMAGLADEALGQAAAKVAEHRTANGDQAGSLTPLLISTVTQAAADKTKAIYDSFESLAGRLARRLSKTAEALDMNDAPEERELLASLREMPRFDLGALDPDLRFIWLSVFGKAMARRRVESRLREQIGKTVLETFSVYGQLLRAWVTSMLREMQNRFNAHADAYRAQLARQTGGGAISAPDTAGLRADLKLLLGTDVEAQALVDTGKNS